MSWCLRGRRGVRQMERVLGVQARATPAETVHGSACVDGQVDPSGLPFCGGPVLPRLCGDPNRLHLCGRI